MHTFSQSLCVAKAVFKSWHFPLSTSSPITTSPADRACRTFLLLLSRSLQKGQTRTDKPNITPEKWITLTPSTPCRARSWWVSACTGEHIGPRTGSG